MNKEARLEAWEVRKTQYAEQWKTGLMGACGQDPLYCCFALCCPPCSSYHLRKRALYGDMNRYQCCNGFLPCSGRCGESNCPEVCLCCEACCCFGTSVAVTRWMLQDELRIQNSKCDNCILATTLFFQQLACICQLAACIIGSDELQFIADVIYFIAEVLWWSVCACMQTQHKVQMDERDERGTTGAATTAPPPQIMLTPQAAPAAQPPGYPGSTAAPPPPQQAVYPPPGYPGSTQPGYPASQPMYDRTPQMANAPPQAPYMNR